MVTTMTKLKKTSKGPRYHTDPVAERVFYNMLEDFRASEGDSFCAAADTALRNSVPKFREYSIPDLGHISVGRFKRYAQVDALLKKYRFAADAYTDDELLERTIEKFFSTQKDVCRPLPLKFSGFKVLQRARKIAHRILGEFPGDEVINECRFGRKSSIGCPLSLAYIDHKLTDRRAFTGTAVTADHFRNQVLPGDHILNRIVKDLDTSPGNEQLDYNYLNLVAVPKTWKTYRIITPLTLIGLFYSYGVGRVLTGKLKDAGLNIATLQHRHRKLVKGFSRSCSHATADLSAASDSITSELLNRVLPRPWYTSVKKCFVRTVKFGTESYHSASVLPMGNGATFPLETLVFYCIIKAIGELTKIDGIYSVYGDDLIYPSKIHKFVCGVFPQLHFKLNLEKTFVNHRFRESCGSDFYRGQDVRPFFIKGEGQFLTRVRYEAFLYKVLNGLLARWDALEIPRTIKWLMSELVMTARRVLRVPPSFPDYSGLKVESIASIPLGLPSWYFEPISVVFNASRWYCFRYLTETPKKRVVKATQPYYWLALQGITDDALPGKFWEMSFPDTKVRRTCLQWRCIKKHRYFSKNGKTVKQVVRKHEAVVASRTGATVSTATTGTGSISDWI